VIYVAGKHAFETPERMARARCGTGTLWNTSSRQHHGEFMSGGIFLVRDNDELVEMREQPYNSEDALQRLLAEYSAGVWLSQMTKLLENERQGCGTFAEQVIG
jgi:hypothetical protein